MTGFREIKQQGRLGFEHVGVHLVSLINWIDHDYKNGASTLPKRQRELKNYLTELAETDDSLKDYIGYKGLLA